MSVSEVPVSLWGRDAARCVIQVPVADDFGSVPVLVRLERLSLPQGPRLAFRWRSAP